MRGHRKRSGPLSAAQRAWLRSPAFHAARLAGLKKGRLKMRLGQKCGAVAKSTGQPCSKLALANGRCRYHGGLSPKGNDWHRVQYQNAAGSEVKLAKKLREVDRRRKKQAAQVAAMSPDERARHEEWARTHRPMSPAAREQRRQDRDARKRWAGLGERSVPQAGEEAAAIASTIATLKARRSALAATNAPAAGGEEASGGPTPSDGVFE